MYLYLKSLYAYILSNTQHLKEKKPTTIKSKTGFAGNGNGDRRLLLVLPLSIIKTYSGASRPLAPRTFGQKLKPKLVFFWYYIIKC